MLSLFLAWDGEECLYYRIREYYIVLKHFLPFYNISGNFNKNPPCSKSGQNKGGFLIKSYKIPQNFRHLRRRFLPIYIRNTSPNTRFWDFWRRRRKISAFLHHSWAILQSKMMIFKGKAEIHLKFFAQSKSQNWPKKGVLLRGGGVLELPLM